MLGHLIVKELRAHILTARFQALLVLQVVALAAGFGLMTAHYQARQDAFHSSGEIHRQENRYALKALNSTEEYELHDLQGVYVARAPAAMSWAVRGLEDWLPVELHISLRHSRSIDGDLYRNPLAARFPAPDLLYLALYLLSLLAIVLFFDSLTGEREQGTLHLMLTQGLPRYRLLLGKWIGGYIALATGTVIGGLVGLLFPLLTGTIALSWPVTATLAALMTGVLLYLAVFVSLGLFVSCLTRDSSTALVNALLIWTAATLVLPGPIHQFAARQTEVLSKAGLLAWHQELETANERTIWALPRHRGEDWYREQRRILEETTQKNKTAATADYQNRLHRQTDLARTAARLLPSGALSNALTTIADTGVDLAFAYEAAENRLAAELKTIAAEGFSLNGAASLSQLRLATTAPLAERLAAVAIDLAVLSLYSILLFLAAHAVFLRRDLL